VEPFVLDISFSDSREGFKILVEGERG